jgi:hypothetical protein
LHDAKLPARALAFISDAESRPFLGSSRGSSSINLGTNPAKERLEDLDLTQNSILQFATHVIVGDRVKMGRPRLAGRRGSTPLDLWRWQAPTALNPAFSATSIRPRLH